MFKIIFFLWRKPSLNRDQFIDYYENRHAPLGSSLSPPMPDYRRNYPIWSAEARDALGGFDVMTEIWHNSRATFETQITGMQQSPNQEIMAEDEDKFIIRARQLFIAVDEHGRDDAGNGSAPPGRISKHLRFVRAPAGISAADFRDAYERSVVPANRAALSSVIGYRRNYALFDDPYSFTGGTGNVTATSDDDQLFHLVEEIWSGGDGSAGLPGEIDLGGGRGAASALQLRVDEYRSPDGGALAAPVASS